MWGVEGSSMVPWPNISVVESFQVLKGSSAHSHPAL
jgi:hypothetical protein